MSHAQNDALDAVRLQQTQLMHDEGLAVHFEQRLGHGFRDGTQTGGEAAGENRNGHCWIQPGIQPGIQLGIQFRIHRRIQ